MRPEQEGEMPATNVNRFVREIEEAAANAKKLYNEHQNKAHRFGSMQERNYSWARYLKAAKKTTNLKNKLKTMNQNALQVQLAKINNIRKNLNKNLNKAMEGYGFGKRNLIQNAFRNYAHWNTYKTPNRNANLQTQNKIWTKELRAKKMKILEAKLKNLPTNGIRNEYFKKIAPIALQYARLKINENALKNAVELRKKHLAREKPARNKLRSIIKQKVLPPIKENINYAPYGRETLNAMRRFPGFKEKTLEEYAMVVRQRNRLQRELENLRRSIKLKRNNNNRN
jgi:hypothetical protein